MKSLQKVIAVRDRRFLFKVENSASVSDYGRYERIRERIWRFPEDALPSPRNLLCENFLHDGSSIFIAVYAAAEDGSLTESEESLAGFAYGFVGCADKSIAFRSPENLRFYAQYLGVLPLYRSDGLGVLIKEFQRQAVLDLLGVGEIVCTYDPLVGVNAHRNIHLFGMDVLDYREDVYNGFGGLLNRTDVPTDRFFMSWKLMSASARPHYDLADLLEGCGLVLRVERRTAAVRSGPLDCETVRGFALPADIGEFALVRIPRDFCVLLRETDVDDPGVRRIPVDWRLRTREAFQDLFERGFKVVDFRQVQRPDSENYYVLRRS